jgi:BTB/POZ domain
VVTIIIGPEESKETFIIHKELICHYSPFFSVAFNSNSKYAEGATQTMKLPDVDVENFGLFVQWVYNQQIDLDPKERDANILPLAKLWTLAERFLITKLQNKIMDKLRVLVEFAESQNLKDFLHYAYESKQKSPLKRLAVDRMAWTTTAQALSTWILDEHLPEGMLVDIVMSLKRDHVHGKVGEGKGLGDAKGYYVEAKAAIKVDPEEA